MSESQTELGPCPKCGKPEGQFKDGGSSRFRYLVICGACAWSPGSERIKDVAVKLWNEAKATDGADAREPKPRAPEKRWLG